MADDINFFETENSLLFKKITSKKDLPLKGKFDGYFIESSEGEIRKIFAFLKNSTEKKKIAIKALDETFNRRVVETLNFDYLVSLESNLGKDSLRQRSSGINHIVAKSAAMKNISFVVSIESLMNLNNFEKAKYISRIIQNIKICRKAKCSIKLASFSSKNSRSFLDRSKIALSWGLSSQQISSLTTF
jgi:RNase P/RNase MRP subunit p30